MYVKLHPHSYNVPFEKVSSFNLFHLARKSKEEVSISLPKAELTKPGPFLSEKTSGALYKFKKTVGDTEKEDFKAPATDVRMAQESKY